MDTFGKLGWLIVGVLSVLLLIQHPGCGDGEQSSNDTLSQILTKNYDSTPVEVNIEKPKPVSSILNMPSKPKDSAHNIGIDSMAIVKAYYTAHCYMDTLQNDTNLFALLSYQVYMNESSDMKFVYKIRKPTTINQTTIIKQTAPKRVFYGGVGIATSITTGTTSFGPELYLLDKQGRLFGVKYHIPENTVGASIAFKLGK